MLCERHRRDEGKARSTLGAIKSLRKERRVWAFLEPERTRFRNHDASLCSKSVRHQFPASHIACVLAAWEFGDAERTLLISHGGFRPCATQRSSRCEELREPSFILGMFFFIDVLFELETGGLKFTKRGNRRSCKACITVNKR